MKKTALPTEDNKIEQILYTLQKMTPEELKEFEELYRACFEIKRFCKEYLDELSA